MAINLAVTKEYRVVPVRFERAFGAPQLPHKRYPEIDDRGFSHKVPRVSNLAESEVVRGGVVSVAAKHKVEICLVREEIDNSALLYASSSDPEVFSLVSPKKGKVCEAGKHSNICIKTATVKGVETKTAFLNIHFGSQDGPIIGRLMIYVFPLRKIAIQPYFVTIHSDGGDKGVKPAFADRKQVFALTEAIWYNAGVKLVTKKSKSFTVSMQLKDAVHIPSGNYKEFDRLVCTRRDTSAINIYIVHRILKQPNPAISGPLGVGLSRINAPIFGVTHPGVLLALKTGNLDRSTDAYWCANDIAHEIGHFLSLYHPSDYNDRSKRFSDSSSYRLLMHNTNPIRRPAPPQHGVNWPDYNNLGYGTYDVGGNNMPYRSALISMKKVRSGPPGDRYIGGPGRDGQCSEVHTFIGMDKDKIYN